MNTSQNHMKTALKITTLLVLTASLWAQTSNITATITDPDGQTWNNGTFIATFVPASYTAQPSRCNGSLNFTQQFRGSMNASGTFTVSVCDNGFVTPPGAIWQFTLCSNTSAPCQNVTQFVTGANPNLSTQLSNQLVAPRFGSGQFAFGYSDAEVITSLLQPGSVYFNVTSAVQRVWNGTAWVAGSGGPTLPAGVAPGSVVVSNGAGLPPIYQPKLFVDMRDADPAKSGSAGVKCDNSTDDTAAIQAYLTYYGHNGPGANVHTELQLPIGTCKITNQLVYEGDNSTGVRIAGVKGFSAGTNSALGWYGPNFGSMMLMLGCNGCELQNVDFVMNEAPNGGGKAQNGLWIDASNTVTQATYNLSAITRSGNVVTATTSTAHAITGANGPRIIKVAASTGGTVSFNGTFQVLYSTDNTHVSWVQKGPNESGTASTGTLTNYQSQPSNLVRVFRSEFSNPEAVSTAVTSATGAAPVTITASAAHSVFTGDTVIYKGGTDATYSCAYLVTNINSSTVITASPLAGTQCSPSGAGATGGTLFSGSSAIRVGHTDSTTPQISSFYGQDLFLQGDQLGGSVNGFETDVCGNTKDFALNNLIINGFRYGVNGFCSGNFNIFDYNGSNVTPDTTPQLATIDFVRTQGQVTIQGAEIEAGNARFFINTAVSGNTVHLDGISFQANGPTDDIIVGWGGTMQITGSSFLNRRAAGAVPYLQCLSGNPLFTGATTNAGCSLVSHSNFYANSLVGGSSTTAGFVPFRDGSGNGFMQAGGFLLSKAVNVESIGDQSSQTNDNTNPVGPLTNVTAHGAIVSSVCGGTNGVSTTGWLRGCSTDTINFRNNANTADINVISKNSSDVVSVGGTSGVNTSGPTSVGDGSFGSQQTGSASACETSFGITTLSTVATTTNTSLNCLPANAVIDSVVYRITTTITTAASFTIGDSTTAARFCSTQSTLTAGTAGVCFVQADQTGAAGPRQVAATTVRVTTNVNPGAGAIRLIVYYHTWTAPTS